METQRRIWRWLSFGWSRETRERELEAELKFHLDEESAERQERGLSPEEARRGARLDLGNLTIVKESTREAWGWGAIETWMQDLRYGMRTLAKNPAFTITAVLSLALGIGANVAIYSIINAVMVRTLPVKDPQELVALGIPGKNHSTSFTNPLWEVIRDSGDALAGMLAYSQERFDLSEGGESRFIDGLWVSGGYFDVLGVPALRGRVLTSRDDRHGGGDDGPVAVISYDFWRSRFQANPGVVGQTLRLNRQTFTVVGVTPPWMKGLDRERPYDVAIPIGCEPLLRRDGGSLNHRSHWWLRIVGRLKPGAGLEETQDRMRTLAPEIFRATMPADWGPAEQQQFRSLGLELIPAATGFSAVREQYRTALFALMAIVGLVLLIACLNVANLLLARAAARRRELTMRAAIGASRWRLVRQLITESVLLSGLGACGGLLLALLGSKLLVQLISTSGSPVDIDLSLDFHVLAFTAAVAVVTVLVFGLVPALRATRVDLCQALKEGGRGAVRGASRFRLGSGLAAGQIAVSFVLLVAAGLFVGTLRNLLNTDLGFRAEGVLLVDANVQLAAKEPVKQVGIHKEILSRLRTLPGVTSASSSSFTPIARGSWNQWSESDGHGAAMLLWMNGVSPGYFQTLGTPLLSGRDFNDHDALNAPLVTVINESAVRQFFGSANPLGKTIRIGIAPSQRRYQVIGVVKDAKYERVDEKAPITGFVAIEQHLTPWPSRYHEVRYTGSLKVLTPAVRAAMAELSPDISLEFRSLEAQVDESLQQQRAMAVLSTSFGALALLLSMVGLYGVTSYAVATRKGEIGIRMALGASTESILWLVLRDVAVLLAVGTALGALGALVAGRLATSLLYGVKPNDPVQMFAAAAMLAMAITLAACLPARRAARIDPMRVLRDE